MTTHWTVQHPVQRAAQGQRLAAVLVLFAFGAGLAHAADVSIAPLSRAAASAASASSAIEPLSVYSATYRQPSFPGASFESGTQPEWSPSRSSVQLFESPHDINPGQPPRRSPRLAIGFRSEGMRHAMGMIGIDAHTCMAPIVRLRGKMANDGGVSGTFWVSARCSFR